VPKRLSHKSKEEQLLRCADRMKSYPRAVDTIYIALSSIRNDPDNAKYRTIDKTTKGYQRTLANTPGAADMFKAMNFLEEGGSNTNKLVLLRARVDPALLYLGISALEKTRQTPEYLQAKRKLQFAKEIDALFRSSSASAGASATSTADTSNSNSKPLTPRRGGGALITIQIADQEPLRRNFDGDDTLDDILKWLGRVVTDGSSPQNHNNIIPNNLLERKWSLMDLNQYPMVPTDVEEDRHKTLQYIGFFPSARLEIVPSTEEWHLRKQINDTSKRGSALGLGAGK
ncbi:MAG: hypothetical protein SGILL_007631, partial [Bacillariaceae sp.]